MPFKLNEFKIAFSRDYKDFKSWAEAEIKWAGWEMENYPEWVNPELLNLKALFEALKRILPQLTTMIYLVFGFRLQFTWVCPHWLRPSCLAENSFLILQILVLGLGLFLGGLRSSFWVRRSSFCGWSRSSYWLRPSEVRTLETWLSISSCNAMGWKQLILGKSSICNLPVRGVMGMGWVRVEGRLRGLELEQREAFRPEVVARDFG